MRRQWRTGLALLGMALAAQAAEVRENVTDYATSVPLTLSGEGPWYRLQLPMEAHLAARHADFRDLRLFNAEGELLAYSLIPGAARFAESQQSATLRLFPLRGPADRSEALPTLRVRRGTDGSIIELNAAAETPAASDLLRGWLLDASATDFPLQRLQLQWNADSEGFQRFSIEASDDLDHWRPLGEGQIARLSFDGERIDKNEVEWPPTRARYLRLLWQMPEQAASLSAATVSGTRSTAQPAALVWSQGLTGRADDKGRYTWTLPLALPLERLRIEVEQPNSLAPVLLQGRWDSSAQWTPLARSVLYRLPVDGHEVVQDQIELPQWPVSQLRLQVDGRGGGLGQHAPRLSVALRASELLFLARGSPPYQLALGKADAQAGSLPVTTLVPGFTPERLESMGRAVLGSALAEVDMVPGPAQAACADWKRIALWAVLLLGVVVLLLMALSLLRASSDRP
ncbi:DUF3999 domain-containing protein [Phytopseudomonas dryadis]|uniref:DUF3999 domain-containing protein n=1 Tax=Phytopseudomonas dryadis TaxID=2487520 RepID=A0ABY1Z285_9GAMM|nr:MULTISPECIES: DUF3999 domain-containing protein [Pseudomonas]TBV02288.1 DUF3999 domain-containing protein [Pseudomonas dryadis]TBV15232.1 DUF3999 domain-containing protein [Pseudomonas sp. FRB 230]